MPTVAAIKTLVKDITVLSNSLPRSVQQATKDNKIWSIMNAGQGETAHETFNRCFDAMFGQECRDSTGCLKHIRKGKLGMGLVCSYLSKCDWADGFPLDLVEIKLVRLVEELKHLRYVFNLPLLLCIITDSAPSGSDVDSTTQTQPSRNVAPTSKLTDANDAAQPELSFQRQAIEAFHTRAQEATSPLTSIDTGHTIHAANPPTRPSPKRTVSAIVDADTEQPESGLSGGDQDTDGQPCMFMISMIEPPFAYFGIIPQSKSDAWDLKPQALQRASISFPSPRTMMARMKWMKDREAQVKPEVCIVQTIPSFLI